MENEETREKFAKAVREYTPRIFKMIYNMTGNYEKTRDLTQDVFLKAWEAYDDFRGESSLYTWIYRIALNRVYQYRRKKGRKDIISIEKIPDIESESNPEENIINDFEKKEIKQKIKELPDIYQNVIILRYFENFSYSQISRTLEIPVGTVRSRLHRGLKIFKSSLRSMYDT